MIARVSKKLKGSICIPSVSQKSMVANQEFYIDDAMLYKPDVQNALSKKMIIPVGEDVPKPESVVYITNIVKGSISVPGVGIIRAGETRSVSEAAAATRPVEDMEKAGVIRIGKRIEPEKRKRGRPRKEVVETPRKKDPSEWNPLAWNPLTEDGKVAAKPMPKQLKLAENPKPLKKKRRKAEEDEDAPEDMIFDPSDIEDEEDEDDTGNVIWVDHEETQKRLASHPVLGKKKNANNRKRHY